MVRFGIYLHATSYLPSACRRLEHKLAKAAFPCLPAGCSGGIQPINVFAEKNASVSSLSLSLSLSLCMLLSDHYSRSRFAMQ